ncbi:hypothetical protein AAFF_G00037790 [Aldrovandia affinis]|uniref:Uncharacterized protein n=1 Tax=Aldrovandia affinis TaxID=143900 RepID=A0AAD7T684_9TELE|nr:hypothetical protein AAFF_G00037790 [Aldrovandia affinis]
MAAAAATAAWTGPVEGDECESTAGAEPPNPESAVGQAEEEQPTGAVPPTTDQQQQLVDGKSKPASEKIWGSFLKNSGLGKVMGGRKKREPAAGAVDGSGEGVEQEKPPAQGEGPSPPASPKEQGTPNSGGAASREPCIEKEPEGEGAAQEQKPSGKEAKPKQGEKSSVRDLIRKPVARIFSHRSAEKKESVCSEAPKHGKTRSKSLDRLEDAEVCPSAVDQTDEASQAGGEPHKSAAHSARHMKRWHSFKKLMAQKSLKKSVDDPKDADGAEGPSGETTQPEPETSESAPKPDHAGQKRWKLKRSWTFQGLKRDPSVVGIHKPKGSDRDLSDDLKGEETERSGAEREEEEKGPATTQRAKSVDHHHANEIWTSFKKRVIPKSKRSVDAGGGGGGGGGEEEQAGDHEQAEEQQGAGGREHAKSAKSKRSHFNRAVSLKNFIMRKGKSASVDMGDALAGQKEEAGERAPMTPLPTRPPQRATNGGDDRAEAMSESASREPEVGSPDTKEEAPAEPPASGAGCEGGAETQAHGGENGSSTAGCDGKGSGTEGEDEKIEDIAAVQHDCETAPREDGPQEKVKMENDRSGESRDETTIPNQEQPCAERKCCSGNPAAQSEKMAGRVQPHTEH